MRDQTSNYTINKKRSLAEVNNDENGSKRGKYLIFITLYSHGFWLVELIAWLHWDEDFGELFPKTIKKLRTE
jgi:hypothetical protein